MKGRGVWSEGEQRVRSEGGVPFGVPSVGLSANRSVGRSDPKRLKRRVVSGENVEGIQKTSGENIPRFFCSRVQKNKKRQQELGVLPI